MTKKEYVERNIGLTFDFLRHLIVHPEIIDTIPDGAELDFIDKDMPVKDKGDIKRNKVARYKVEHVFEPIKQEAL
jgi:hypothetical protein